MVLDKLSLSDVLSEQTITLFLNRRGKKSFLEAAEGFKQSLESLLPMLKEEPKFNTEEVKVTNELLEYLESLQALITMVELELYPNTQKILGIYCERLNNILVEYRNILKNQLN